MGSRYLLAQSENYEVSHEYEVVLLTRLSSSNQSVEIGDFYGDPQAAIIDEEERFVIMVGCGMIIYNLAEPFEPYRYDLQNSQWRELLREPKNPWWIEGIIQAENNTFHFTVDPNSDKAGTYAVIFPNLAIQKLS